MKTEKAHTNTYLYTSTMARASKQFHVIIHWLNICQISASYVQFLWCYSQISRPTSASPHFTYPLFYAFWLIDQFGQVKKYKKYKKFIN